LRPAAIGSALAVASLAAVFSWQGSQRFVEALGDDRLSSGVVWFGERIQIERLVGHELEEELLTVDAPLEPLLVRVPLRALMRLRPESAALVVVRAFVAASAALWTTLLFATLACCGCALIDVVLFTAIGATSLAAQFWFATPSTLVLASATWMVAPLLVARAGAQARPREWPTVVAIVAMSIRLSEALSGVVLAPSLHGWRRGFQTIVNAVCVVLLLWAGLGLLYPASGPAPASVVGGSAVSLAGVIRVDWLALLVAASWIALLVAGVPQLMRDERRRLAVFVAASIAIRALIAGLAGEQVLHASLGIVPLLVMVAALGGCSDHRRAVRVIAVVLVIAGVFHSRAALAAALDMLGTGR
jgi:hypothetical protein